MQDSPLISIVIENAREIFKAPDLAYDPGIVFQDIRGFDSIQAVQFILAIEAALGVMFSEEEVDNMRTMGDLVTMLDRKRVPQ
jgi:acyl carrier protein